MAIFTPRGLKIRLPFDYAFALMARLYPEVSVFKILKTTEGIEFISSLLMFVTSIVCFYFRMSLFSISLYVFIASIIGFLISSLGIFVIPGLVRLATFYSYLSGYGIYLVFIIFYGFTRVGWQGVAAYFIAQILAGIVKMVLEAKQMKKIHSGTGIAFTTSEKNFVNAYRLHADKLGKTTNTTVSDEELKEENWMPVFKDFATKWPEIARRFTID